MKHVFVLLSLVAPVACLGNKPAPPKPCCEQPAIPPGVASFVVVADEVTGPSDGQTVQLRAALTAGVPRSQIYPVLHTLYRHAMTRKAFEPTEFAAYLYADEGSARAGGDGGLVAEIGRRQGKLGPRCENKVPFDFTEQATRAFASAVGRGEKENMDDSCRLNVQKKVPRPDDDFTHKPSLNIETKRKAVTITYPYLEMGKDEYVATLTLRSAMRDWIDYVNQFFDKVADLDQVTFVGLHKDQTVVNITVSRADFHEKLSSLQDEIASFATVTVATLADENAAGGAAQEQAEHQTKTYRAALAALPKSQVTISPKLK
jgi:hypothetical protein